jgi:hypothetical protein
MAVPSIASVPGPSIADPQRPLKVGVTVPVQEGELAGGTTRWPASWSLSASPRTWASTP